MVIMIVGCQSDQTSIEYKYYTQDQLKTSIENQEDILMLDIQVEDDFNEHHIEGAVATYAFPVKSDEDKAKIDTQLQLIEESDRDIVIICPKGLIGAERTYTYLLEKGVKVERLFILEEGQAGWKSDMKNEVNTDELNDEETESSDDT